MSDELKPCPFCGAGKTEITDGPKIWLGMRYGDPTSVSVRHWCAPIEGQPSRMIERIGRDRESAIAAWNRRSAPAVTDAVSSKAVMHYERLLSLGQIDKAIAMKAAITAALETPDV